MSCPNGAAQLFATANWYNLPVHTGSADYFHTCATNSMVQVPNNVFGSQLPYNGNAYIGMALCMQSITDFREYVEVQLTNPLLAGYIYEFNCRVSLSEVSGLAANSLSVYLSPTQLVAPLPVSTALTSITPQMTYNAIISDKVNWTNISMMFVANGGEQYMVLGNFKNDANTSVLSVGQGSMAYIYIDSVTLTKIGAPTISVQGNSTICIGDSTSLNASGGNFYNWAISTNPSSIINTGSNFVASPSTTTTYLIYSNIDTAAFTVYVNNPPTVFLGKDTSICNGAALLLDVAMPNATYLWQNNTTSASYSLTNAGLYWVSVTQNGCTASDTIKVDIIPLPTINLGNDISLCEGVLLPLNATTPNATYWWQNNSTSSVCLAAQAGLYWVQVTVNGCSTTDSINVNLKECALIIPNAFTPNADGLNDVWHIIEHAGIQLLHLKIYNRWGQEVFDGNESNLAWDGQFKGEACETGTYFYVLQYRYKNSQQRLTQSGDVTLIR